MNRLNKGKIIIFIIILALSISMLIFTNNNYLFYKTTILRIDKIEESEIELTTDPNILGIEEKYYIQKISGTIMNGNDIGKVRNYENEISTSSVVTEKYKEKDYVFIDGNNIIGLKRDTYIVFLISIFVILLYIVGNIKGLLSIVSVIFNLSVFLIGISLYMNGVDIVLLVLILSIIFTVLSLLLSNGINKTTLSAIISVVVSIFILTLMTFIIIGITKYNGVNFNGMSFLTVPPEAIFTSELLIGGLGAIMDVCITISSSIKELVDKDNSIKKESLILSGKNIGKDIMGTMINVLFFTYLSGCLPVFVLAIRNGVSLTNYISANFSLELTRFLIGSIGLVLAIPISLYISIKFNKRGLVQ